MSTEQNKALARQLVEEVLNKGNMARADEILAPDFVEHEELPPGMLPDREAPKQLTAMLRNAFPDFKATINDLVAEGDKVVIHMTWSGTQQGEFMGIPPTGQPISVGVFDILRIAGGQIVEHWGLTDTMSMMQQLGVMPTPGQGES